MVFQKLLPFLLKSKFHHSLLVPNKDRKIIPSSLWVEELWKKFVHFEACNNLLIKVMETDYFSNGVEESENSLARSLATRNRDVATSLQYFLVIQATAVDAF